MIDDLNAIVRDHKITEFSDDNVQDELTIIHGNGVT